MDIKHMNKTVKYGFMAMGVVAIFVVIGIISLIFEGINSRKNPTNNIQNDVVIENRIDK